MRRFVSALMIPGIVASILAVPGTGRIIDSPTAAAVAPRHPLIGAWILNLNVTNPSIRPALGVFSADGTYVQTNPSEVGVWTATGERSAAFTFVTEGQDSSGSYEGLAKIRGLLKVDQRGDTLTAQYTVEVIRPDGSSQGEQGFLTARGTRITVEPMGRSTPATPTAGSPEGLPAIGA